MTKSQIKAELRRSAMEDAHPFWIFGKAHGKKFSLKKIDDEYRIWRVK